MGSAAAAAFVAHVVFWVLLVYGYACDELTVRGGAVFVALWLAGALALPHAPYAPIRSMLSSWVAILDIGLVFTIFNGDVHLT